MWDTLRFREHAILEDMEPLMYLNATAKRIGNLKEICYIYRYTEGSASEEARFEHYHKQVLAAMEACYEKLHVLPCYDGIREAVEYAILQLYAYALVNCLQQKGKIEDEQILQMQEQLRELRLRCVTGNCQNQYVQKKIDATSQRFMELNDADPRALLREVRSFI
jgi:hypothetical protein